MSAALAPTFVAPPPAFREPLAPREELVEALVPVAAELVGVVRDYGPADVAAVLARVPGGRFDALAVVLAAMVDPDRSQSELLRWTDGPVSSRGFQPQHLNVGAVDAAALGRCAERRMEIARLTNLGWSAREIAERLHITPRAVNRHRAELRAVGA